MQCHIYMYMSRNQRRKLPPRISATDAEVAADEVAADEPSSSGTVQHLKPPCYPQISVHVTCTLSACYWRSFIPYLPRYLPCDSPRYYEFLYLYNICHLPSIRAMHAPRYWPSCMHYPPSYLPCYPSPGTHLEKPVSEVAGDEESQMAES